MRKTTGQKPTLEPISKPSTDFTYSLADNCDNCQKSFRLIKSPPIIQARQCRNKGLEVIRKVIFFIDTKLK